MLFRSEAPVELQDVAEQHLVQEDDRIHRDGDDVGPGMPVGHDGGAFVYLGQHPPPEYRSFGVGILGKHELGHADQGVGYQSLFR